MPPASERPLARDGRLRRALTDTPALDLALRLTLLDLLLAPVGDWSVRPFTLAIAGAGLLLPGLHRSRAEWCGS